MNDAVLVIKIKVRRVEIIDARAAEGGIHVDPDVFAGDISLIPRVVAPLGTGISKASEKPDMDIHRAAHRHIQAGEIETDTGARVERDDSTRRHL